MGTPNDQAVLQAIFNPDAPFGDVAGLDLGEEAEKEADEDGIFSGEQLTQSKALELQGVMAAEAGDLNTALERFGQAICLLPERASPYNNRAQARRLQGDVAGEGDTLWSLCRRTWHTQTRDEMVVGLGHGGVSFNPSEACVLPLE
nr:tetratricopeptide repeat protein 36 [Loxodonta africana]